ncbi:acyl-[acyl-carrier-protein] thioesterase [Atopobium fossor]|uniref:acyl-[acyl-carrier-protein] thioesterase n=1 Tax=Atopobium fossor TaxID=39487 RepID=UPI0004865992|nr:acyl-ACP thioesterase domain-containing protein [Atopobium fossor]
MYSFSSRIRYSETDEQGNLSLVSLINYLQDCALFQTDELGVGLDHLTQKQLAWLIAGWQIQITQMPQYGQDIVVSTWPTQIQGVFAHRNFTICSPDGFEYIRADSLWFMFDFAKQSPIVPPEEEWGPYIAQAETPLDMPKMSRKLRIDTHLEGVAQPSFVVSAQHLDTNHHVNNAQYVEFARAAAGDSIKAKRILVQYVSAAMLGDTIVPVVYTSKEDTTVSLNAPNEKPYAIVKFLNAIN